MELVVREGADGVTIRAVSQAAGANVAAVHYHFGSRAGLLAALVQSASAPVIDAQRAGLAQLAARDGPVAVADLVGAWGRPLLRVALSADPSARRLGAIVGQALAAPRSELDEAVRDVVRETDSRLVDGLREALPQTAQADLWLRLAVMATVVAGLASGAFEAHLARAEPGDRLEERLLEVLTAIATTGAVPPA